MVKGTLFGRLLPPLAAVVALLTLIMTVVGLTLMRRALVERAQFRARSLSALERDSIERLMRAGEHRDLQRITQQVGQNPDVAAVRLLTPQGRVVTSSQRLEVGMSAPHHVTQRAPGGDVIHAQPGHDSRGELVVHTVQPIENAPSCHQCHASAGPVIALLDMDIGVNRHTTGLLTFSTLSLGLGMLYVIAIVGIATPLLGYVVVGPLRRLIAAMQRVERGDLDVSVEPAGTREIDAVVSGFNGMVGRLRQGRAAEDEARRLQMERVEQLATVGELAAGFAHEIRNPLSGVKAILDLLAHETQDPTRRHVLGDAASELVRIDQIVRDLLQYARPKPPALAPFELNALATDAVALSLSPGASGPRPTCELGDGMPLTLGDAGQIRQVLVNLLLNAKQASGAEASITLSTGWSNHRVWCRVRDDGPGVPADRAETIFRPFFTSKSRGTGLGLSISRRIAELHGGALVLDNPGQAGASFTLSLPAKQDDGF